MGMKTYMKICVSKKQGVSTYTLSTFRKVYKLCQGFDGFQQGNTWAPGEGGVEKSGTGEGRGRGEVESHLDFQPPPPPPLSRIPDHEDFPGRCHIGQIPPDSQKLVWRFVWHVQVSELSF